MYFWAQTAIPLFSTAAEGRQNPFRPFAETGSNLP